MSNRVRRVSGGQGLIRYEGPLHPTWSMTVWERWAWPRGCRLHAGKCRRVQVYSLRAG